MDLGSALKKVVPNPNRRSAHYTRQPPFEGSESKIRGAILKLLLKEYSLEDEEIFGYVAEDPHRVRKILGDLEGEGFIKYNNNRFSLCE